jgi:hypothetical protein
MVCRLLFFLSSICIVLAAEVINIPILRRSGALDLRAFARSADLLRKRYAYDGDAALHRRQSSAGISLINQVG